MDRVWLKPNNISSKLQCVKRFKKVKSVLLNVIIAKLIKHSNRFLNKECEEKKSSSHIMLTFFLDWNFFEQL